MGLEKAIEHGKEKRRPYRGAKRVDVSCRNHGDCPICKSDRLYNSLRRLIEASDREREFEGERLTR